MKKNLVCGIQEGIVMFFLLCVFCPLLTKLVRAEGKWRIQTVDSASWWEGGVGTSIAIDADGYPHISYRGGGLKYAQWNGSSWEIETVDSTGSVGRYTSLALDTNDYAYISYYDYTRGNLKYAKWNGSFWDIETVDSAGDVGWFSSLALDTNDYAHISYCDYTNGGLKYAQWNGSSWDIETVDSAGEVGKYTSIALDTNGCSHISYYDGTNGDLKYGKWDGVDWSTSTVDSAGEVGEWTCVELDANGYPHISYYDEAPRNLKYAQWNGSSWDIETVDSAGNIGLCTSIALDANGCPYISYYDETSGNLKYASPNNKQSLFWTGETNYESDGIHPESGDENTGFVFRVKYTDPDGDAPKPGYPKVRLKKGGIPYGSFTMSYASGEYETGAIYTYARTLPAGEEYSYYFEAYDELNGEASGAPTAETDGPNVSELMFSVKWSSQTVDSAGKYTSIALDADGYPHISYYDEAPRNLKYAQWNGSSWEIETVDSAGDVGKYTSVALDANGRPHISYYDETNGDLKHAQWNVSAWDIETVDSGDNVGKYTSIALDANGYPHISHYNCLPFPFWELKYAQWNGSSWEIETVDSAANVGEYTSIALDANGRPHISYFDGTNKHLKYAQWNGSSWDIETVDSAGGVGKYTSVALDANGRPYMSYYDETNGDLKYAQWNGSSWEIETVHSAGNVGEYTSIALDANDYPHIGYFDNTNDDLKYAQWNGSSWEILTVADGGDSCCLSLDLNGHPHMSYVNGKGGLSYVYGTPEATYYIRGYVKDAQETGINGVTMTLSGAASGSRSTNSEGYYEFSNLVSGNYAVTPSKENYSFEPASRSYAPLNSNQDNQNFTATSTPTSYYYIKGYVKDSGETGISGVAVNLFGEVAKSVTTITSGYYEFLNLSSGTYTVTPSKSGYTFSPPNRAYSPLNSNQTDQNFTGTEAVAPTYFIRGHILEADSKPISGVTMNLTGQTQRSVSTTIEGYYEFLNLSSGTYTVTPSKNGWTFEPVNYTYDPLNGDETNQNFIGTQIIVPSYAISGYVLDANSDGISRVTVSLSGDVSKSTTTASSGSYAFTGLAGGNYTVTPTKTGYSFEPGNRSYSPLNSDQTQQNFIGSLLPVLSISHTSLDFGEVKRGESKTLCFQISNTGAGTLSGTISSDKNWIKVSPTSFTGNSQKVNVAVDNSILNKGEGQYTGAVTVASNGGNKTVDVKLTATCVIVKPHPFRLSSGKPLAFWGSGVVPYDTKINIYTLSGNLVKTIEENDGKNELYWDGTNNWGNTVVPGIYLYTTESPKEKNAGKITVIK